MLAQEQRRQKVLFAVFDALAVAGAFSFALSLHDPAHAMAARLWHAKPSALALGVLVLLTIWLASFRHFNLYRVRGGGWPQTAALLKAGTCASIFTLIAVFLSHLDFSRLMVTLGCLLTVPLVIGLRGILRVSLQAAYNSPGVAIPLLIVGFNELARILADQVQDQLTYYELIGFFEPGAGGERYRGLPVFGANESLPDIARHHAGLEVAIAVTEPERQAALVEICERLRTGWWLAPWLAQSPARRLRVEMLGDVPLIGPSGSKIEGLNYIVKRVFDLCLASILLVATAPLMLVCALAILLDDGPPVFFRQVRVGRHDREFEMLKFRTMRSGAGDEEHRDYVQKWIREGREAQVTAGDNQPVFKLVNDGRVTRVGRWLRRYSLDELPQLLNVIRGEMSLIGPRPALPYETQLYKDWHWRRFESAPGITGLWQVSGRNQLSFDDMVQLDLQYFESWSLGSDLRILARTVPALLRGSGA